MGRRLAAVLAASLVLTAPWSAAAQAEGPERFSLSMFHFNVQYVAGGLLGYPDGESFDQPVFDLDDEGVQDQIIRETFVPVLRLLEDHPSWTLTLELQGHMVEAMMERHPDDLDALRDLVDAGQVELVSFHYSDQLFLAYPPLDMERSHQLLDQVMDEAGLALSAVVFCQEGQFGVGMGPFGAARGRSVLAMPKNLFRYQHAAAYEDAPLLFDLDGMTVILAGRGYSSPEVEVSWSFFDDGELLATGDVNPYAGTDMDLDPEAVAEYEQRLLEQEAAGWRISSIGALVEWAEEHGIEPAPLPPVLDGTWQPGTTNSMYRWMGAAGIYDVIMESERDNVVLTENVRARHRIVVAETLVAFAEARGLVSEGAFDDRLMGCWRDALLGQVTDASGINPFVNEVRYGLDHGAAAFDCAQAILEEVAPLVGDRYLVIDTDSGDVQATPAPPSEEVTAVDPLFSAADGFEVSAEGREVEVRWERVASEPSAHRVRIEVSPPEDPGSREIWATFPLDLDAFAVTPGLTDDRVDVHPFDAFDLEDGRIALPLANGLVGIGEGLWLIKQTDEVHVAAMLEVGEGVILFRDRTVPSGSGETWVFWVLEGDAEEALDLARRLNLAPTVTFSLIDEEARCGCACRAAGAPPPPRAPLAYGLRAFLR